METYVIKFYLFCRWKGVAPTYRLYFNDELLTERTYIWNNTEQVLQERVCVTTGFPTAIITVEQVGQHSGKFSTRHIQTDPPGVNVKFRIA